MVCFTGEVPVFADTSLGTCMSMAVSPDITTGDLKRKFEKEHQICFPNLGEIKVHALMVKRNSFFYHLSDFMPIKNVFHGPKGAWFLRVEANPANGSDKSCQSKSLVAKVSDCISDDSNVTSSQIPKKHISCLSKNKRKDKARERRERYKCFEDVLEELLMPVYNSRKKKRKLKEKRFIEDTADGMHKRSLGAIEEAPGVCSKGESGDFGENEKDDRAHVSETTIRAVPSVSSSEVASITDIITRYFPQFDEVNQFECPPNSGGVEDDEARGTNQVHQDELLTAKDECHSKSQVQNAPQCMPKTPPRILQLPLPAKPSPGDPLPEFGRTEVGKRLLLAANNLGISATKKNAVLSNSGKVLLSNSSPLVRSIVFDISDSEDWREF
ncbi:PREDICTED: uncharacterized protein LOC104594263 [Nelumbo nucifera]|uniref:Uncharacterized protein LOC104594263 n=1 Tax=Nelumbo nucifera TaxID=4432 RepID=A0A1U7ZWA8_NELNU|nr:PREDICTED: uncharacterized protein LOC104594263 [Nelumbo nucifera]